MTRRKLLYTWFLYALCALLLGILQAALFNRVHIWGVHPFVLPCIGAVIATYEERRSSVVFAFFLGFVCDLTMPGLIPCLYMLSFTLSTLGAALFTRRAVMPGFICSMAVSALSLALHGLLQVLLLFYLRGSAVAPGMALLLRETAVSLPFAAAVHLPVARIHRYLADV